jgi:hypothetical protein
LVLVSTEVFPPWVAVPVVPVVPEDEPSLSFEPGSSDTGSRMQPTAINEAAIQSFWDAVLGLPDIVGPD